jgi:hypothetical protein
LTLHLARHGPLAAAGEPRERLLEAARQRFAEAFPGGVTLAIPGETSPALGRYEGVNRFVRLDLLPADAGGRLPDPMSVDLAPLWAILGNADNPAGESGGARDGPDGPIFEFPAATSRREVDEAAPVPYLQPQLAPASLGFLATAVDQGGEALQRTRRETEEVGDLLGRLLPDEDEISSRPLVRPMTADESRFPGLAPRYGRLLERLLDRPAWPYREFDALARELDLMPDAGLDHLNNWALEKHGDPVVEEGEPLIVNRELVS